VSLITSLIIIGQGYVIALNKIELYIKR